MSDAPCDLVVDFDRELLLDMVTTMTPSTTPFLRSLTGTELPMTQHQRRGKKFWDSIRDGLWLLRHPMIPAAFRCDYEDGFHVSFFPNWLWRKLWQNTWSRVGNWMERRGYTQKYAPPTPDQVALDLEWLGEENDNERS